MSRHFLQVLIKGFLLLAPMQPIFGANFVWLGTDFSNDMTLGTNWNPAGPPQSMDVGQLSNAAISLNPSIQGNVAYAIGSFSFLDNTGFIITASDFSTLQLQGAGVQNFGSTSQIFAISGNSALLFRNSAAADSGSGLNHYDVADATSLIAFFDSSSANTAAFSNTDGSIVFLNNSRASFALIEQTGYTASTSFFNNSGADFATITSNNQSSLQFRETSSAGAANLFANSGSTIAFFDNSIGFGSNITLNNSNLFFNDFTNASSAIIEANSSILHFTDASTAAAAQINMAGSAMTFEGSSTAENAVIQATNSAIFFNDNAKSASASITLNVDSALNFHQNAEDTFSGTLAGDGIMNKDGYGHLNFLANGAAYNGQTFITQGNFALKSIIGGDIFVSNRGFLSGSGSTLGNITLSTSGGISPSSSSGVINIFGNYTQGTESYFLVKLNGEGQSNLINIVGTANINEGIVDAVTDDGTFLLYTPYTILHADNGVIGSYIPGRFLSNPVFKVNLFYDPFNVFLILGTNLGRYAFTSNQQNVAAQIDALLDPSADQLIVIDNLLNSTPIEIGPVLDQLSGEQYTALVETTHKSTQQFLRRLYNPLRQIIANPCCNDACANDLTIWGSIGGGHSRLSRRNAHGYCVNNYNLTLGTQKRLNQEWTLGVAGAYEEDCIGYCLGGTSKLHYGLGGFYGLYSNADWYVLSDLVFGYNNCHVRRSINFTDINARAHSKPKIFQTTFYAEAGKNYELCDFALQPFVGIETSYYNRCKSNENGADILNLEIHGRNLSITTSRLGVHSQTLISCGFTFAADIAWQHNFNFKRDHITSRFQDFGNSFRITGVNYGRDSIDFSLFAGKAITECLDIYAEISGQAWKRYFNFNFTAGILYNW